MSLTNVFLQATELIQQYYESGEDDPTFSVEKDHLKFTACRDVPDASAKLETKFGCSSSRGLEKADLAKRNLLKGITANESTIVHVLNNLSQPIDCICHGCLCQLRVKNLI